jgi:hypothetical protein
MFANLKALLVVLPLAAFAFQATAQAQTQPRGLWELSPMAPLMGPRPVQTANYTPSYTANPRPDTRAQLQPTCPPITFPAPSAFWPRGNDDLLTLAQIQNTRNYIYQRLLAIVPDPRVSLETVMAVNADYQYWCQLYSWKLDRTYPHTAW